MSTKLLNDDKTRQTTSPNQSSIIYTYSQSTSPHVHPISIDIHVHPQQHRYPLHKSPSISTTTSISIPFSATPDTDDENNANAHIDIAPYINIRSCSRKEPCNLPPELPITPVNIDDDNDNDNDDDLFESILVTLSKQESISTDKRRSLSSKPKKPHDIYGSYGKLESTTSLPKLSQHAHEMDIINIQNRGRRSTIRPRGSKPIITSTLSVDIDSKRDIYDSDIDENSNPSPKTAQSKLVFESTTESLMISCGNSREVFAILKKICINLKKDELLPYIISFKDKILKYDHVESFLKLLGFIKNKQLSQYICCKKIRVSNKLIDYGILECDKCLLLIQSHLSVSHFNDIIQLYELICNITHNNSNDAKEVLLLCYPMITDAKRILQCCEARFYNNDDDKNVIYNNKFNKILSSFSVQAKVIQFIRHWMQRYWDKDWHLNNKLLSYCKSFSNKIKKIYKSDININKNYSAFEIQKGLRLIQMLETTIINAKRKSVTCTRNESKHISNTKVTITKHRKTPSKWRMSIGNIGSSSLKKLESPTDLIDINYVIIAEQITITQFSQFKLIHPRECIDQSWKKNDKKHILAPNITQYINLFNKISKWIQTSILVAENIRQRAKIIKKWIKVEQELYKLRNFQTLCAVHCALSSTPIYMLKDAFNLLAKKYIIQHNMIKVIMKPGGNWKNLRRLQLETHPPMLPYFGMFAKDLIAIEESTNNRSNDGSINWNSLYRVNTAINKHLIYQNTPYNNLQKNVNIQKWIQKELNMSDKLDNEWVYQVSKHVSKKDKHENLKSKSTRSLFYNKSK